MKNIIQRKKQEGFTIIEVLIVLAIAGLIILIVFLAVPALQRNSRNTQRGTDASRALGAVQEVVNNNNGRAPIGTTPPGTLTAANFSVLQTVNYDVHATAFQALPAGVDNASLYIRNASVCSPSTTPTGAGTGPTSGAATRQITVAYLVESPGTPEGNVAFGSGASAVTIAVPANNTVQCVSGN